MNPLATSGARAVEHPKRFYTVAETAHLLGLSESTMFRAIRSGEFAAIKVRGRYVVPAKIIDSLEQSALTKGLVDSAAWGQGPAGLASRPA